MGSEAARYINIGEAEDGTICITLHIQGVSKAFAHFRLHSFSKIQPGSSIEALQMWSRFTLN